MNNKKIITAITIIILVIVGYIYIANKAQLKSDKEQKFIGSNLQTNTAKTLIPLDEVLGGGPVKDGIPALSNPKFIPAEEVDDVPDDSLGILVEGNRVTRFYPYTVLVWHEIVNDTINDTDIAVTFCPLCGSAIVYERSAGDTTHEFGVSGKLWQSNLLMYDRATESLWSQIEGRAVVGDMVSAELNVYPSQLVTFVEAKNINQNVQVLSSDTGYNRDYGFYPYGDYEDREDLIFPVNNLDVSLPAKTLMYASVINGEPIAFNREKLLNEKSATLETASGTITARVWENNTITLTDQAESIYPGYVTMWFSWANHNESDLIWR